jgi:hypothetical protein
MPDRRKIPTSTETSVLMAAGRRCCLCVFLKGRDEIQRGQIAHLNGDADDSRFENLVWLCLDHHDEFDSTTSQSKGFTRAEVKAYRDKLYRKHPETAKKALRESKTGKSAELPPLPPLSDFERVRQDFPAEVAFIDKAWRYPLWQVANQPDLFAYKAENRSDGICLIERIDIPDGRIVVACIGITGNPGNSITNAVGEICFQVCERFEIPPARLVWLEHYEYYDDEWSMVSFGKVPPSARFSDPTWTTMTSRLWRDLRLRPKRNLRRRGGAYESKIVKLFPWPMEAIR